MVCSRKSGEMVSYPSVEMEFNKISNQVEYILSPAQISNKLKIKAEKLALIVAEKFKISGIIKDIDTLGNSITGTIKNLDLDYKGFGKTEMNTAMYISRSYFKSFKKWFSSRC